MANTKLSATEIFVNNLAQELGISKKDAKRYADATFRTVITTVQELGSLRVNDFGKFEAKQMKARKIKNIHTGQYSTIPSRNTPKFTPSQNFKECVNGSQQKNVVNS